MGTIISKWRVIALSTSLLLAITLIACGTDSAPAAPAPTVAASAPDPTSTSVPPTATLEPTPTAAPTPTEAPKLQVAVTEGPFPITALVVPESLVPFEDLNVIPVPEELTDGSIGTADREKRWNDLYDGNRQRLLVFQPGVDPVAEGDPLALTANDDRLLIVEEYAFCGDGRAVYLQHTANPIVVGESFVYEFTASEDGGISYTAMAAQDSPITHDGPDPKRITIPFDPVGGAVTANVGVALVGIVADGGSEIEEMCSSAPGVEIESLSAVDRVIAGLPEPTPENSAAVEGSPQEAVIARFEAENTVNRTLTGTDRLMALQDFCPPDQRLTPEEITPEMGADRDAAVRRILERAGTTPESLTIGGQSVLITIPTEAFVLFTVFGEVENWDMGVEWIEIDSEWYHNDCAEGLFLGIPLSYGGR